MLLAIGFLAADCLSVNSAATAAFIAGVLARAGHAAVAIRPSLAARRCCTCDPAVVCNDETGYVSCNDGPRPFSVADWFAAAWFAAACFAEAVADHVVADHAAVLAQGCAGWFWAAGPGSVDRASRIVAETIVRATGW